MLPGLFTACLAVLLAADPQLPDLKFQAYELPNGLRVVLHRDASVPQVSVVVAYHVGSTDERAGKTGFAHFFEHMMFRGTKNVPNYDIPLQETGGQSNAFTTEDVTVYFETVPTEYLERALYLEAERLGHLPSALDKEKFDTEREVVKNERRLRNENQPYGLAEETLLAKVFPAGHPYSWSVIGSMADLNAASLDDLRKFFLDYYHPGNATLCLSGDFDPAAARVLIAKYFGPLAPGKTPPRPAVPAPTPSAARVVQGDRVSLPRVYWAWPAVASDHPDAPALDLLADVLTSGDASRLHRALILDTRVASDVDADSDTKERSGLFTINATAAEGKSLAQVEAVIASELARLKTEPPTARELARVLAKHEKSATSALTSPQGRGFALALGSLQKNDPAYYRADLMRYFRVTPADLARVAATYLIPEKVVLEVIPLKPGIAKAAASKAGPTATSASASVVADRPPAPGPDWTKLPGPGAPAAFVPPTVVRKTLSNGVDVLIVPWKTLPIVNALWVVPAGTVHDPSGKSGLASLHASMLTQGTRDRTATELAEALDELGVTYGTASSLEESSLSFNVLARNLDPALALLVPMFTAPRFDPADFARERDLQLAGLSQGPDNVSWIAGRAFRALLFGADEPYGRPDDGYVATVKTLTLDDVKAFHAAHWPAAGSHLLIAGDVDPDAIAATLERLIGGWRPVAKAIKVAEASVVPTPNVIYLVDKPGAVQSVLRVGRRWVARNDPRYFATQIGNHVFGVDFLSRLNRNLREKNGYTYGAGSTFSYRSRDSVWLANSAVRGDATAPALKEMIAELDGVAGPSPLSPEEITLGREATTRSFPDAFDAPGSIVGAIAPIATYGLPLDYLATYLSKVRETPADQVRAAMSELAAKRSRTILVVGDRKAIEPSLKALGLGEIRILDTDGKPVQP